MNHSGGEGGHPYVSQVPASYGKPAGGLRRRMYDVIFEADTPAGRRFDILLVCAIMLSILAVVLDSVPALEHDWGAALDDCEWGALLLDIRILRLLRVFRIFKLTLYIEETTRLGEALAASRRKILLFLSVVLMLIVIMGTVMSVIEGPANGFTSIPTAMYWATVTMTTVGYGDIAPRTGLGKALASCMMLLGWGILAVPAGIVTAEMTVRRHRQGGAPEPAPAPARRCPGCGSGGHQEGARYCKDCGAAL